ncbi:MAG TPA: hypothetical protein VGB08_09965 [Allosphingosinicella sp.]|jgi:hypothetical protein
MNILLGAHILMGCLALLAGAAAVGARKGGRIHAGAGIAFASTMLFVGVTATILARLDPASDGGMGGILTCYFVATSWVAARRRDGVSGRFEMGACALAMGGGAAICWAAFTGAATTPGGAGPLYAFALVCLLAGLGDLKAVLRRKLTPAQRLSRHLWRMCFAFFIATGSFFIGQQDVMPVAVRGSPVLFVLGFAPFAVMLFWLVRLRFSRTIARCTRSGLIFIGLRPQPNV